MGFFDFLQSSVNSQVGSSYTKIYFDRHSERFHYCVACGKELDREISGQVTIDHIVPQKLGGTNAISNLQVLCRSCNSTKKAKVNHLTLIYSGQALTREIKKELSDRLTFELGY